MQSTGTALVACLLAAACNGPPAPPPTDDTLAISVALSPPPGPEQHCDGAAVAMCPAVFAPVCAQTGNPETPRYVSYDNGCIACTESGATRYHDGACEPRLLTRGRLPARIPRTNPFAG